MSTPPKGWSSQEKDERLVAEFSTVEPIRSKQYGLSVLANLFTYEVGTDAVEAGSLTYTINATAHVALVGDIIRFTSGTHSGKEVKVSSIATNVITLGETLSVAPAAAVTFQILRHKYPVIASDGSIPVTAVQAAIKFTKDGSDVTVNEDTVTPANNRPLPVKLTGVTGDLTITAQNLNVQSTHTGANPDSMQIGDGTNVMGITLANEAKVSLTTALPAGTNNIGDVDVLSEPATVANAGAIPAVLKVVAGYDGANVRALKTDASGELQVDVLSSALPSGAATDAKQDTGNTSLGNIDSKLPATLGQKTGANSLAVVLASDQALALPSGASTLAEQQTQTTSLQLLDDAVATSGAAITAKGFAAVGTDGTNARVLKTDSDGELQVDILSSALPSGAATLAEQQTQSTTLSAISGKLPATLGQKTMANSMAVVLASDQSAIPVTSAALDVVDFIDTNNLLDTSATNIPGSGGSPVTVVASLAANVKKIQVLDTTGSFFGVYTGAAASEVLQAVVGPGSDSTIDVAMSAGERVSLKRLDSVTAVSVGIVAINFLG